MTAEESPGRAQSRRLHPLLRYAMRRLLAGLLLAWVVSVLVFAATQILPGDAATAILGRRATPEAIASIRAELGLDRPLVAQYAHWLGDFLRGDLGDSFAARMPVTELISGRVWNTVVLAGITIVVMLPLSLALGVLAGVRSGKLSDHVITGTSLGAIALPEFVTGTLLAAFLAISLGWLPPVSIVRPGESPLAQPDVLVLPVVTLLLAGLAYNIRMVRAGVVDVLRSDYVRMARLEGISERRVIWRHVLPNALAPTIQVMALTVLWLVGGVVVVETVFTYPGLGSSLVDAVGVRDLPVVQAIVMYVALLYIAINILADILVVLVIPKLRTGLR